MKILKKFLKSKESKSTNKSPVNIQKKPVKVLTAHELAEKLGTDRRKLEKTFVDLGWTEKSAKGTKATQDGISNGAQTKYHDMTRNNYVVWDESIMNNTTLQEFI
ncbi:hypothetical protein PGH07_05295 [Sulfurovum sp. zt1-1]|uniref:Uncharacterized protein n=1 Tax=Sulfurovum zhangzhouensis TaxID=3019067 RepID=A0ABT7QXS2_9BACT|nr:hypothetical protein [Sulfurovum zhangzhouensis]MDM5271582.1 hypothetical protein [Sulfurovum zhangzhouensis]